MMTQQEAIKQLKYDRAMCLFNPSTGEEEPMNDDCMKTAEALGLAIEALKQQKKKRWIPVTERLPEEHKWIGTECFGTTISDEVYVTIEAPSGDRIVKHLCFQNGAIPSHKQRELDAFYKGGKPIAWRPLPEPYKEDNDDAAGSNRQG